MSQMQTTARAVIEMMKSGTPSRKISLVIAAYLLSERKTGQLASLLHFIEKLRKEEGIVEAEVFSAHKLSNSTKQEIQKLIRAKKVILHESIENGLLGGFVVKSGEIKLDLSIKGRIQKMKQGATG